jgi:hypothetical protein
MKALKRAFREDSYLSYAVKRIKDGGSMTGFWISPIL